MVKKAVCGTFHSGEHKDYTYIIHAAVTLDYHRAGVCCIRNRENDRKVSCIVDRKPEKE